MKRAQPKKPASLAISPRALRQRAEAAARASRAATQSMARKDVLRLVDELQVHQIELEMQNEELRQAQAELAQSRDRFNDLYDFAPVGYVTLDEDGTILEANLTAATMLGIERNKLVGRKFTRFVVPGAQDTLYLHHRAALADDGKVACDLQLRRKDGTTFSARMETICARDASTPSRHCRSALLDITERKTAEQALAVSHEELEQRVFDRTADLRRADDDLREAQRIASIGNWSWDAATDAVTGSEELLRIFGFDPATQTMPAFRKQKGRLFPKATWDRLSAAFQETIRTGSGFELDVKALRAGAPIWVAIHGEMMGDARGRAVGLRGTMQDITVRKQAEAHLRLLETSIARLNDVVIITEAEPIEEPGPRIVFVNEAFTRHTGYTREEVLGRSPRFLQGPGTSRTELDRIRTALREWKPVRAELINCRKNGEEFWVELDIVPVADESGWFTNWVAVQRDITNRKRTEAALLESERRERQRAAELAAVLDAVPTAVLIADDPECRHIVGNRAADKLLRIPRGGEASLSASEMARPRHFKVLQNGRELTNEELPAQRAAKGTSISDFEETIVFDDGTTFEVLSYATPLRNEAGQVQGSVLVLVDITERKLAEAALRESESRYRTLFSSLLEGFCIIDVVFDASGRPADYRFLEVNPAFAKQTGLRRATGRLVSEILPKNEAHWFEIYGDVAVTGIPQHFVREAKALKRWYEVSAFRLGGTDSRKVAILFNDITESKRSELALRESEERYRQLMHGLPVAMHTCDAKGRIVLHNAAAAELWGREPDLHRDRWCGASRAFTAEGQPLSPGNCPVAQTVRRGQAIRDRELIIERPDGSQSHVLVFPDPIRDSAGVLTGAVVIQVDITALKAAENALRTSERNLQKLSRAVEQSPTSVLITSPSGEIDYVNPKFTEVTGYELEEVLGKNPRLLKSGVQPCAVYREMWKTITAGQVWRGELCNRKKNGELFWEFAVIAPIEVQGTITHFIALKEDITERRRAADALRESEGRLRAIFDQAIVGIAQADLTGRFLAVNERFCRLVGRPEKEILQKRIQDFTHPDDLRRNLKLFKALIAGGPDFEIEKRYARPDGTEIWVQNRVNAIRDAAGAPQSTVAISIDITQRRQAERQRARLAAIVASSADAMFSKNLKGIVETWNAAAERLYGYTAAEMIGQPVTVLIPPERAAEYRHIIQTARKGQQVIGLETYRRRKDGSEFPISLSASPIRDAAGKIVGTSIIATDITARRQLEAEVLQIAEAERERLAAELHDGTCQELTAIQFLANLLRRDLTKADHPLATQARRIEDAISEATEHTREVARGMNPVVADGTGLMHALRQLAETTTTTRRIRCAFECPKPVAIENAIASHELYRIAQEAVHNALQHGHAQRITLRLSESGGEIRLSVKDNGRGLRADVSRASGMGLRVMKYRASSIGGQFLIQPRRGGGAEVLCRVARPAIQP